MATSVLLPSSYAGSTSRPGTSDRRRRGGLCRASPRDPKKDKLTGSYFSEADPAQGLQKLWGQSDKDVFAEKDTLIWNVDWQSQLDAEQKTLEKKQKIKEEAEESELSRLAKPLPGSGFLSLSRSLALDDMNAELESRLMRGPDASSSAPAAPANSRAAPESASPSLFQTPEEYERAGANPTVSMEEALTAFDKAFKKGKGTQYRYAPTKGERRQWAGSSKFSNSGSKKALRDAMDGDEEQQRIRAQDLANYEALKQELVLLTLATSAASAAMVYPVYGQPVTVSYLFGALGGVVYLRLLAKSVDNTSGPSGIVGVLEGTLGGQRLLIPAILAAGWNRWNALIAPDVGFELQILPILAGFFTYKAATVVQVFKENLGPMMSSSSKPDEYK